MYLLCVLYVPLLPLLLCRRAVLAVRLRLILRIRRAALLFSLGLIHQRLQPGDGAVRVGRPLGAGIAFREPLEEIQSLRVLSQILIGTGR